MGAGGGGGGGGGRGVDLNLARTGYRRSAVWKPYDVTLHAVHQKRKRRLYLFPVY